MARRLLVVSAAAMAVALGCGGGGSGAGAGASSTSGGPTSSGMGSGGASTSSGSGGTSTSSGSGGASTSSGSGGTSTGTGGAPSCSEPPGHANGSVTFYTFDMGSSAVNCSFDILGTNPDVVAHVPFGGGKYFGAMNTADYDTAAVCGACVEVDRDDGRSVQIMIVDQCPTPSNPKCITGHIDLSKEAFLKVGQESEGYLGTTNGGAAGKISWKYIPCPEQGPISFRLKEPTNQYWNQILVMGHANAVTKLEALVNGSWQAGVRQPYNYWQVGDGNMGPPPYHVRVTDVHGATVEAMLALAAGDQAATGQFPACP